MNRRFRLRLTRTNLTAVLNSTGVAEGTLSIEDLSDNRYQITDLRIKSSMLFSVLPPAKSTFKFSILTLGVVR